MEADKFQHWMGWVAEANAPLLYTLAGLETRLLRRRLDAVTIDRPIYVTGLARSGTTILLEKLHQASPQLASYRYKDFPFVMLPHAWNRFLRLAGQKPQQPTERAHADRITITPDSPEAMEEILWMHHFPHLHDPTVSNLLTPADDNPGFAQSYRDSLRKLLLTRRRSRYLAKGNYNLVRLPYLLHLFPHARFIVPIRDPAWHIASLIKQHRLLTQLQREDPRILAYMRRCGHFEFGQDLRPINPDNTPEIRAIRQLWQQDSANIEGWARYWALLHTWLADLLDSAPAIAAATHLVSYEHLCAEPTQALSAIYHHAQLDIPPAAIEAQAATLAPPTYYQPDFTDQERQTLHTCTRSPHQRLLARTHA